MATVKVCPGGWNPPGPIATRHEASQQKQPSSGAVLATSPPEATWSLDTALHAKALVVTVSTPEGLARLTGGAAKALLALDAAGERGLSPGEVMAWTAQLGSAVRDLKRVKIAVETVRGNWRFRVPVRYVLTCQPDIAITRLVPHGGVL